MVNQVWTFDRHTPQYFVLRVSWLFTFEAAVYSPVRMRNLAEATAGGTQYREDYSVNTERRGAWGQ